eukprot:scaffold132052_cov37-Prasinocladus_malaysianus.AAC.1
MSCMVFTQRQDLICLHTSEFLSTSTVKTCHPPRTACTHNDTCFSAAFDGVVRQTPAQHD